MWIMKSVATPTDQTMSNVTTLRQPLTDEQIVAKRLAIEFPHCPLDVLQLAIDEATDLVRQGTQLQACIDHGKAFIAAAGARRAVSA